MPITLQDPTRLREPASRHAFPDMQHEPRLGGPREANIGVVQPHACGPPDPLEGNLRTWICPDCGQVHKKAFPRFEFLRQEHQRANWVLEPVR